MDRVLIAADSSIHHPLPDISSFECKKTEQMMSASVPIIMMSGIAFWELDCSLVSIQISAAVDS
jgi:hypothetical protein